MRKIKPTEEQIKEDIVVQKNTINEINEHLGYNKREREGLRKRLRYHKAKLKRLSK